MAIKIQNSTIIDDSRNIINAGVVTAQSFVGNLTGTATTATFLSNAANITTGTISTDRLSGTYNINITGTANEVTYTTYADVAGISTFSGISTNVIGGIASVTNLTVSGVSTFNSRIGIGTTNSTAALYVVGDTYVAGILTANRIFSNVYGEFTGSSVVSDTIVGSALSISGISTLGVTSASQLYISGVTTSIGGFVGNLTGTASTASFATTAFNLQDAANITTGTINSARLTGTYNIDISGNAATATNAGVATYATNAGISTNVIGGIASVTNLTVSGVSTFNSNVGIGTTNPTSALYVVGDSYITGILTANRIISSVYGEFTGGGISGTNIVGTALSISGISTLGVTSVSQLYVSGVTTSIGGFVGNLTGTASTASFATTAFNLTDAANITTGTINSARLSGSYNIDISGNAATANYATNAGLATAANYANVAGIATYATNAGLATAATYASTAGVATALQNSRTFEITGDILASPITFDGTGNVSLAATIQPNSVGLGTDTTGNYVQSITGTTNEIEVTGGIGEGSTPQIGLPNDVIITNNLSIGGVTTSTGGFVGNLTGTASTASFATTAFNLTDAANIATGTINSARLTGTYNIDISGNAATSTNAGVATYATNAGLATASGYANVAGIATYATNAGLATAATYASTAGVATALQNSRTFEITGDIVASPISFDGTGNVSLAATIQPNSVALGSDTTGDYVQSISGTSNQITVTSGTGEGSTPTLSIPSQFTVPQDLTVLRDVQIDRNLNVNGNITIGGTTAVIFSQSLNISDPDIVLGYRTDAFGNDISNDNTANHGGIAVASTEGNPLVQLFIAGIETNPATYKKIMWFKAGEFAGLGTDAWLMNYAVGVGSTQFPTGTRLAAGSVQLTENDIAVVRNINASGIVTASGGFVGNLTGTASTASFATTAFNLENAANITTGTINSARLTGTYNIDISGNAATATNAGVATYATSAGIATYATNAGVATNVIGGIASVTTLTVSGLSTLSGNVNVGTGITMYAASGIISATAFYGNGQNLSDIIQAKLAGITLLDEGIQVGTPYQFSEINVVGNYVTASGIGSLATITFTTPPYADVAGIATYATNAGLATAATYANVSGIATYATNAGLATASGYADVAGIATYATSAGLATASIYADVAGIATYAATAGIATYATNAGVSTDVIGGIASVTSLTVSSVSTLGTVQISSGIITATSGIVTYYGDGSKLQNIVSSYAANAGVATYAVNAGVATYATNAGIATYATNAGLATAATYANVAGIATYATNAGIATNLKGGAGGQIVYQSALDTTAFLANGTSGQILQSNGGTSAPSWIANGVGVATASGTVGTGATIIDFRGSAISSVTVAAGIATINILDSSGFTVSDDTSTNATRYILFDDVTSGNVNAVSVSSTKLTFNPSTGNLVAGGTVTANSDQKLKTDVQTIENALEKVLSLRGVEFTRIDNGDKQIGVIAQEVEKIIPEVVYPKQPAPDNDVKSVAYGNIVGLLIEAIKEQNKRIEELERKLGDG